MQFKPVLFKGQLYLSFSFEVILQTIFYTNRKHIRRAYCVQSTVLSVSYKSDQLMPIIL